MTVTNRIISIVPFKEFQALLPDLSPSPGEVDLHLHMAASVFLLVNTVPLLNTKITYLPLSVSLPQFHCHNFLAKWNSWKHSWSMYRKMPLTENWNTMVSKSAEKDSTVYLERGQKSWTCTCVARQHDHDCWYWQQGYCHVSYHHFYRSSQIPRAPSILWCFYTGSQSSKWTDKLIEPGN